MTDRPKVGPEYPEYHGRMGTHFKDVLEIIRFIRSAMSAFINSSMLEPSSYS